MKKLKSLLIVSLLMVFSLSPTSAGDSEDIQICYPCGLFESGVACRLGDSSCSSTFFGIVYSVTCQTSGQVTTGVCEEPVD